MIDYDINQDFVGDVSTFVGRLFPGAAGDEIRKIGNSGPIGPCTSYNFCPSSAAGCKWIVCVKVTRC